MKKGIGVQKKARNKSRGGGGVWRRDVTTAETLLTLFVYTAFLGFPPIGGPCLVT